MFTECVGRHAGNDEEEEVGVGITGRRPAGGEGGGDRRYRSRVFIHPELPPVRLQSNPSVNTLISLSVIRRQRRIYIAVSGCGPVRHFAATCSSCQTKCAPCRGGYKS